MLPQLTSKYLHQKTCKSILKLARAKRVEMVGILSKIDSKDTFEILGYSAPYVFENRIHSIRRRSASGKKEDGVYFFSSSFFGTPPPISKRFSSVLVVFDTVRIKIYLLY